MMFIFVPARGGGAFVDRSLLELDGRQLQFDIRLAANPTFVEGHANHRAAIDQNVADLVAMDVDPDEARDWVECWTDESDPTLPVRWVAEQMAASSLSPTRWDGWRTDD